MSSKTPRKRRDRDPVTREDIVDSFQLAVPLPTSLYSRALRSAKAATTCMMEYAQTSDSIMSTAVSTPPSTSYQQDNLDNMKTVYSETVLQQRGVFASMGPLQNHPSVMADLATRVVQLARNFAMNNETTHNGVYLLFTYLAKIQSNGGNGAFIKHKGKNAIEYIYKQEVVRYEISPLFQTAPDRDDNMSLIAASCLCIASKMDESQFDHVLKPQRVISAMKARGDVIGRHAVFDFITVERDILQTLQWRLFSLKGPIFFCEMLFHKFAGSISDRLVTEKMLLMCLSSKEYVLTEPSELTALCLIAAKHSNDKIAPITAVAHFTGLRIEFLTHHSAQVLAAYRQTMMHPSSSDEVDFDFDSSQSSCIASREASPQTKGHD